MSTCLRCFLATLLLGIATYCAPAAAEGEAEARAAFQATDTALAAHTGGSFWLDDDPRAPGLLEKLWSVTEAWAVEYLSAHPAVPEAELSAAIGRLSPNLEVRALRLDAKSVLVAASLGEIGTVFIITAPGGPAGLAWTIADAAKIVAGDLDSLAAWSPDRARESCRTPPASLAWRGCGPLHAAIGRLPDQADGTRRFYVEGTYAQDMGATVTAQLSVWKWTGSRAEPLLAKLYQYMMDQRIGIRLVGADLLVREKDEFRSFFTSGSGEGRQIDWRLRIGPDGIEDLGERSAVPELDLADELYDRLLGRELADDIAAPAVVKALRSKIDRIRSNPDLAGYPPSFGMLMDWSVTTQHRRKTLCISTDFGGTDLFTIEGRKPRIVAVRDLGEAGCRQ